MQMSAAFTTPDIGATPATSGLILVNQTLTGDIDFAEDIDLFRIDLVAGRSYRFFLEGADTDAGTLADPLLGLFTVRDGALTMQAIWDDDGYTLNSSGFHTATNSEAYYLAVASWDGQPGNYRLSVMEAGTAGIKQHPAIDAQSGHREHLRARFRRRVLGD